MNLELMMEVNEKQKNNLPSKGEFLNSSETDYGIKVEPTVKLENSNEYEKRNDEISSETDYGFKLEPTVKMEHSFAATPKEVVAVETEESLCSNDTDYDIKHEPTLKLEPSVTDIGEEDVGPFAPRKRHAGLKVSSALLHAQTTHPICRLASDRWRAFQQCNRPADDRFDRFLSQLGVSPDWTPLSLHPHLQCLRRGGDPAPWTMARRLAYPAPDLSMPSLHPLRL